MLINFYEVFLFILAIYKKYIELKSKYIYTFTISINSYKEWV